MNAKDFWNRVSLQVVTEFMRSNSLKDADPETFFDQRIKLEKDFQRSLVNAKDKILAFNWDSLNNDAHKITIALEEIFADTIAKSGEISDVAFDVGFIAGIKFWQEAMDKMEKPDHNKQ